MLLSTDFRYISRAVVGIRLCYHFLPLSFVEPNTNWHEVVLTLKQSSPSSMTLDKYEPQ